MPSFSSSPFVQRVVAGYRRLRGGRLSPGRFAGSIALGLFVGCLPIYGAHFLLCASLGVALRLDVLVSYAAAHISIPPLIPFLLFLSAQLGSLLLHGQWLVLSVDDFRAKDVVQVGMALGVGSVLLGLLLALLGGGLSFLVASWLARRRRGDQDQEEALQRAIDVTRRRYEHAPRAHRHYVFFKLRTDPLTRQLFDLAQQRRDWGRVVDAGAGRGQFSLFAFELGVAQSVLGFDHDEHKIEVARRASAGLDEVSFRLGDLCTDEGGQADTILLLDVLHYLPLEEQHRLLGRVSAALSEQGMLVIRENNRGAGWGARVAQGFEWLARWLRINRGPVLRFWSPDDIEACLVQQGLCVARPGAADDYGSPSNVLLVATREALEKASPAGEPKERWMRSAVSSSVGS